MRERASVEAGAVEADRSKVSRSPLVPRASSAVDLTRVPLYAAAARRPAPAAHDPSQVSESTPSQSEGDEERAADQAARGFVAGKPPPPPAPPAPAPTRPLWADAGRPLPAAQRLPLERWFGTDLSAVRLHDGPAARSAVRLAGAGAITAGEDVALPSPAAADRPALLAHEVAHVVQQRSGPPRTRFAPPEAAGVVPGPEDGLPELRLAITISGMQLSRPERPLMPGVSVRDQVYEALVTRVVPGAEPELGRQVQAKLGEVPASGVFAEDRIADEEPFPEVAITPLGWLAVAAALRALGHEPSGLTAEQLRVLELGAGAAIDTPEAVARLREQYPWYSARLWIQQVSQYAASYAAMTDVARQQEAGRASEEDLTAEQDAFFAKLRPSLDAVEAIRVTTDLADEADAGPAYQAIWGATQAGSPPENPASEDLLGDLLTFVDAQPGLRDGAGQRREDRVELLVRFARMVGRVVAEDPAGELLQRIADTQRPFTDDPYPATLEVFPTPEGPEPVVPAQVANVFRFMVKFPGVLDAFQRYAYVWDLIEWQPSGVTAGQDAAAAQAVLGDRESRDAMQLETKEKASATTGEVVRQRFVQDLANAKADFATIFGTLGPAGVTALPNYMVVLGTRTFGTVARLGVDYVTLETGPGLRERLVAFPHPGVWIVRVAAVPSYEDASEVTRPPSMAYLAVFATSQVQAAQDTLAAAEAETARRNAERDAMLADVAERLERLGQTADPTEQLESTSSIEQEILEGVRADLAMSADPWVSREVALGNLEQILTEIDDAIEETLAQPDDDQRNERLALLKSQRSAVQQQLTQLGKTLDVREQRIADDPRLATATPLPVAFATDEGEVVQLELEYVAEAADHQVSVTISDYTHPKAGMATAEGATLADAVAAALRELLEGDLGYGRGVAAVKLPGTEVAQPIRIEKSPRSLATEAWESITTIVTIGAIVAAPFTGGASLAILVPIGVVGAGIASYRLIERYQLGTLDWDLETATDLLDIVGGLLGFAGAGAVALKAAKFTNAAKLGGLIVASVDLGSNVAGLVVLGIQLQQELAAIAQDHKLSASQQRAQSLIALGRAMMQIGMMAGQSLVNQGLAWLAARAPAEALPRKAPPKTGTTKTTPEAGLETGTSETGAPETVPETGLPETGLPETVPETGLPETVPETGLPETVPETGLPETVPETGLPETVPETGLPETVPETGLPETVPETGLPETVPETGLPETVPETGPEAVAPETVAPESEIRVARAERKARERADQAERYRRLREEHPDWPVVGDRPIRPQVATATKYEWKWTDGNFIFAKLTGDSLEVTIKARGTPRAGGTKLMDAVFNHFGPDRIKQFKALWVEGSGFEDNYLEYMRNLANEMTPEDAAWNTWTGRQLAARGFRSVWVPDHGPNPDEVDPVFTK